MDRLLHTPQERRIGGHYPENQVILSEDAIVSIASAEHVADYRLKLRFSDGFERTVDFEQFLGTSTNPMIRAYLDIDKFTSFRVEHGDLIWDDYGLGFPIADLYEDKI